MKKFCCEDCVWFDDDNEDYPFCSLKREDIEPTDFACEEFKMND